MIPCHILSYYVMASGLGKFNNLRTILRISFRKQPQDGEAILVSEWFNMATMIEDNVTKFDDIRCIRSWGTPTDTFFIIFPNMRFIIFWLQMVFFWWVCHVVLPLFCMCSTNKHLMQCRRVEFSRWPTAQHSFEVPLAEAIVFSLNSSHRHEQSRGWGGHTTTKQ